MPGPAWENIGDFFDLADFATPAVVTRSGRRVADFLGVFDDPSVTASLGEYENDSVEPIFTCAEIDIAAVKIGDVVTIEGRAFDLVKPPQLDGTGIAVLRLVSPNVIYNAGI